MKRKTGKSASSKWLDPVQTKKWMLAGVILFTVALVLLSLFKDQGVLTDSQAIAFGCVIGAVSLIGIVIDTLAQDKATIIFRLIGLALLLIFAYVRYFA
jgi:hypothetical protein